MSVAVEAPLDTKEASVPLEPNALENDVLSYLELPPHLKELPKTLPERTVEVLTSLYPGTDELPETLLVQAASMIDRLSGSHERLDCRLKVAGFGLPTLRTIAPNLNRSWKALQKLFAANRLNLVDTETVVSERTASEVIGEVVAVSEIIIDESELPIGIRELAWQGLLLSQAVETPTIPRSR